MNSKLHTWEIVVSGRVQGVFFRASTQAEATRLGVEGWVRNEPDGSVRALIQHENEMVLAQMLSWLRQGPPQATVTDCSVTPRPEAEQHKGFSIVR